MSADGTPWATARYLNLETYRRDGTAVRTPVWFAAAPAGPAGAKLYVYSTADAGKVKRIRRDGTARIAPCDIRGTPTGPWVDARAEPVGEPDYAQGMALLDRKYRPWKQLLGVFARLAGRRAARVVLAVRPAG